ncbi:MAG: DUF3501 family protein [Gammaproteobacteria bacterium]|nr:DUF3501 family protein [Gammaproteobacteria bacterium]
MQKLTRADLFSLEEYAQRRPEFRQQVMAHKQRRVIALGPYATLHFEDRLTMHYQVQEMLRAERIFESAEIEAELATYNPLVPDGHNWKATLMLEYADPVQRSAALSQLVGIEHKVWIQIADCEPVFGVADEDLQRSTAEKTSAVHFLRFELTEPMIEALRGGGNLALGIDHPHYHVMIEVAEDVRRTLLADLYC